jgi:predicted amidohydrolase
MVGHGADQAANSKKADRFCRDAASQGVDVVVFPELWNIGFGKGEDVLRDPARAKEAWAHWAIDADDDYINDLRALARELDMAIAATYMQRSAPLPKNSVSLIDRHGDIVFTYSKVHTCDFAVEAAHQPGTGFEVGTLDTRGGEVIVGAMICYDRAYPESARVLMLKGAEVILTPNSSTLSEIDLKAFQVRAYENIVGVAMANYAAPDNNGHSVAYDPITHPDENNALFVRDTTVVHAGENEGIYIANFDMGAIRAYRQTETLGNAYRKPGAYSDLLSMDVADPFVRSDARR